MAVTQYIGSRYVPIFANPIEWSNQNTYEPLTIVTHNGNSYTSKQAVPKDIDILNEDYWAITGNYDAQVEQYRRETAQAMQAAENAQDTANTAQENINIANNAIADINELLPENEFNAENTVKKAIDSVNDGFDIGWISDGTGTCIVCKGDSGVICLDIGSNAGDSNLFYGQLNDFLDDKKIDVIVISHYHDDHSTGYDVVKQFAKDDCVVYEQMNPTPNNTQYTDYVTNRNAIINVFGADNVKVPNNNQTIQVGDLQLCMINSDSANIAAYNSVRGESSRNANGLNVFSIISFVTKNGNTFCHTGDAEGITERLMTPYARPCDIISTPHHAANYLGYSEFFDKCNPSAFLYTKRNLIAYQTIRSSDFTDRFTGRYAQAKNIPFINGASQSIFKLEYNNYHIIDGVVCSATAGTLGYAYSPMEMLGATFYKDDPYDLIEMSGNEYLDNCRAYNPRYSCTFNGTYKILEQTPNFITDIINFMGATSTETLRITPFGAALIIGNPSALNATKMAIMAGGSADLSENSRTIVKIDGISDPQINIDLSEGETTHIITESNLKTILDSGCENFYVRVSATSDISTALRIYVKPTNVAHNEYRGIGIDRSLNRLFGVAIVNYSISAHVYNLTNQTNTDGYIGGYGVGVL